MRDKVIVNEGVDVGADRNCRRNVLTTDDEPQGKSLEEE